jgi:branched-chain amino acid transport system ATP-binding protein
VLANLLSAQHHSIDYGAVAGMIGSPLSIETERELRRRADALLDAMRLGHVRDIPVAGLPYGIAKRVEIAAGLVTGADLLLLDEPSSGMGPDEARRLGDDLLALRQAFTVTIVMIEHHVPLVVQVCDYVYVLNFGQLLTEGFPDAVQRHPDVVAAYLGEEDGE